MTNLIRQQQVTYERLTWNIFVLLSNIHHKILDLVLRPIEGLNMHYTVHPLLHHFLTRGVRFETRFSLREVLLLNSIWSVHKKFRTGKYYPFFTECRKANVLLKTSNRTLKTFTKQKRYGYYVSQKSCFTLARFPIRVSVSAGSASRADTPDFNGQPLMQSDTVEVTIRSAQYPPRSHFPPRNATAQKREYATRMLLMDVQTHRFV